MLKIVVMKKYYMTLKLLKLLMVSVCKTILCHVLLVMLLCMIFGFKICLQSVGCLFYNAVHPMN